MKMNKEKKGSFISNNPILKWIGPQKIVVVMVIILLFAFFSIKSPAFRQYATIVSIFDYSYYISLMAIGVTFALVTGGVDLSIGTGMIASGLVGGYVVTKLGMPVPVGILASVGFGLLLGCFNAYNIAVLGLPPFIATLGSMMIARGLGSILTGGISITWPTSGTPQGWFRSIFKINTGTILLPVGFLLIILTVILMSTVLNKTRPGRYIIALGSNKEASRLSGINVVKWQALAYIICGLFTGLAGVAYAATFQAVPPGTGAGLELDAIAGAIVGGTSTTGGFGSVVGTLLGVFVLSLLKTGLPFIGLQANWQQIITCIVLLIAVFIDVVKNKKRV